MGDLKKRQSTGKTLEEFYEILNSVFPESRELFEGPDCSGSTLKSYLTKKNKYYKNTPYFYNGDLDFVHWTSLQSLFSIINNREIRLYNLHSSTDKQEFEFSAKQLEIPQSKIENSKKYLYTFSCCEGKEISNSDLWTKYGRDYEGVAIQFEIQNSPIEWDNYMISQIKYKLPKELQLLKTRLDKLIAESSMTNTVVDLGRLIAFHKEHKFSKELEIRLAIYFPFDCREDYHKYCNTEFRFDNKRPRSTSYFGLKLWTDNSNPCLNEKKPEHDLRLILPENYFQTRPEIRIKKVCFGKNCGVTDLEYSKYRTELLEYVKYKLGYVFEMDEHLYG